MPCCWKCGESIARMPHDGVLHSDIVLLTIFFESTGIILCGYRLHNNNIPFLTMRFCGVCHIITARSLYFVFHKYLIGTSPEAMTCRSSFLKMHRGSMFRCSHPVLGGTGNGRQDAVPCTGVSVRPEEELVTAPKPGCRKLCR